MAKSNHQRKMLYKAVNRKRDNDIRQHRKVVTAALNGILQPFFDRLKSVDDYKETFLALITDNGLRFAIRTIYTTTGFQFAKTAEKTLRKDFTKDLGLNTFEMNVDALLNDFTEGGLGFMIQNMTLYTRRRIAEDVVKLMSEGLSFGEIGRQLEKKYKEINRVRGLRIARTEVIKASNWGVLEGANASGVPFIKEWNSINDSRRRSSHKTADGKQAQPGKPFNVNGSKLMFPGDTSLGAKASETINCRCVVDLVEVKDYDPSRDSGLLGEQLEE